MEEALFFVTIHILQSKKKLQLDFLGEIVGPADQIGSESFRSDNQEFGNFRQIGEIILELEQSYPSNSFANINSASQSFSPVDGRFGPESNFTKVIKEESDAFVI